MGLGKIEDAIAIIEKGIEITADPLLQEKLGEVIQERQLIPIGADLTAEYLAGTWEDIFKGGTIYFESEFIIDYGVEQEPNYWDKVKNDEGHNYFYTIQDNYVDMFKSGGGHVNPIGYEYEPETGLLVFVDWKDKSLPEPNRFVKFKKISHTVDEILPASDSPPAPLSFDDLVVDGIGFGASIEDAVAHFGEPEEREYFVEGGTGTEYCRFTYGNGELILTFWNTQYGYTMSEMETTLPGLSGPRGLSIGVSSKKLLQSFQNDHLELGALFYEISPTGVRYPPFGFYSEYEDGSITVSYAFPTSEGDYPPEEDAWWYMYREHGHISFTLVDYKLVRYSWMVRAFAE